MNVDELSKMDPHEEVAQQGQIPPLSPVIDVLEKIVSKPLFEEEIIPMKIDLHPDNAESDLMESLRTHDSSLSISSKIDSLLDEFAGELALLKLIPPGIDETYCDFEEDIRLIEKLLYDNSSPRPPEEFVSANSDAAIESFSPSPILVKDSDSLMEEINLFCTLNYPMPPGIEDDDYDSERDILILKDFPSNNTLSFAKKESFHFDIPPFSRPPAKPPDGNTRILNIKMMGDISDQKAFMNKLMITLASDQEKSPDRLSHRGLKAFQPFSKSPMMIHGQNNPILDMKENQEKDKMGSKSDKNEKRGEARKSQKQLQSREKEKLKKIQVEGPEMQIIQNDDIQVEDQPHADDSSLTAESPGYIADSDSMGEDDDEDLKEDPNEEHDPEDDDEDPEEDPNEEHEPEEEDTKEEEPSKGSDETKPFEEDETALIDVFAAGSPPFILPPTSHAYDQAPLESSAAAARAPRGQYDFVDTVKAGQCLIRSPGHDAL
nr:hypothetical protein [Tanacetum cinerariifolium]